MTNIKGWKEQKGETTHETSYGIYFSLDVRVTIVPHTL